MTNPCYQCPLRVRNCHSTCGRHITWKNNLQAAKQPYRSNLDLIGYQLTVSRRVKRYQHDRKG